MYTRQLPVLQSRMIYDSPVHVWYKFRQSIVDKAGTSRTEHCQIDPMEDEDSCLME